MVGVSIGYTSRLVTLSTRKEVSQFETIKHTEKGENQRVSPNTMHFQTYLHYLPWGIEFKRQNIDK